MWVLNADQTVNGTVYKQGDLLTATQDSETFVQAHWLKRVRYTDDTAIDNLEIGGVNLINGNTESVVMNTINWRHIPLSSKLIQGKTYILGGEFRIDEGTAGAVGLNNNDWGASFQALPLNTPFVANANMANRTHFCVAKQAGGAELIVSALKVKLEEGNKKTTWNQAPEIVQARIDAAKQEAERAQLQADGYMRARYIRDWVNGNSDNTTGTWREIQVFDKNGINIALDKTVTTDSSQKTNINRVCDGDFDLGYATSPDGGLRSVKIDLGQVYYDIDYIQVWHYWLVENRVYYGTKTEISEDGVTWKTIFDSEISGTYVETEGGKVHTQRYASVMDRIAETEAKTRFQTLIDGGLIYTALMKLFDTISGDETAFISGKQGAGKNLPAFGAGGSYEKALAFIQYLSKMSTGTTPNPSEYDNLAKITMLHNGAAKVGDFIIEETGRIITVDPTTGKPTLVFNATDLPPINDLVNNNLGGAAVSNVAQGSIEVGYDLPNTISVNKDNSSIAFNAGSLTLNATLPTMLDRAELAVYLRRNGSNYVLLKSLILYGSGTKSIPDAVAYSSNGMPSGTYSIGIEITKVGSGITASANISYSSLSWSFSPTNVRYFQFGRDGMMAFFDLCHWHFTKSNGFDLRGTTNMPGVLAAGSSKSNGEQSKVWGAKSNTAGVTVITGGFRVPLSNMTHSNYVVQITPHTSSTFRVDPAKKTNTSFEIFGTGGFDYVVIGNNYA